MSAAWPKVRLGEVLHLDLDRVSIDPSVTYPMVGVLSFGKGLFSKESVENGKTSYKHFNCLKAEHVVMSQLFGWEGALALSNAEFSGKYLSPQFPTFVCDEHRLNRGFLGWLMRRPTFWGDLGSRASGMGDRRRTLNPDALFACEISLPPLSEQQRIVAWIEVLAGKIREAQQLRHESIQECEALCRSILASDTSAQLVSMRELVSLQAPDVIVRPDETYQFAGVYSFGRGVFRAQAKAGVEFAYPKLSTLRKGNFTYPKLMAWEGALGVVPPECDGCVVSTEFPVFEVNEERVLPEVLDIHFRNPSVWPGLAGSSTGTNVRRRRLNPQDFLRYEIPLPSRETQFRLRNVMYELAKLRPLYAKTAEELEALLPSVLNTAFRGEPR